MADTRELRLFAVAQHLSLTADVETRIRAVCTSGSAERASRPEQVREVDRAVARAGRGPAGRRAVAESVAQEWFVRLVVLAFLETRGWDATTAAQPQDLLARWRQWQQQVPGLVDLDPLADLLTPTGLTTPGGAWPRTLATLGEDGCERVELLGWLHQHFHAARRRAVYGALGTTRADAEQLSAVTQVFTPDWVARTLLDNSLGQHACADLDLPYALTRTSARPAGRGTGTNPDTLSVLDPACGTGLMLTHAFDLLHALHLAAGHAPATVPHRILTQNLHGLDIDPGVVRIAALVLTVKAWEKLGGPHAASARDLPGPDVRVLVPVRFTQTQLRRLPRVGDSAQSSSLFWNTWADADVFGSLVRPDPDLTRRAETALAAVVLPPDLVTAAGTVVAQNRYVLTEHDVVVANPPYLGTRHMGDRLRRLANQHYPVSKGDLATMFLERTLQMCRPGGYAAVVASESWCVTTRTRRVRDLLLERGRLRTAVCVDAAAFGVRVNTVASVLQRGGAPGPVTFTRVGRTDLDAGPPSRLPAPGRPTLHRELALFDRVPDRVLVMDLPESLFALYAKGDVLGDVVDLRQGMATTDNTRFLRRWWEVPVEDIDRAHARGDGRNPRWVPYNKGGSAVRWWGNQEYVVLWEDDARELRQVRPDSAVEDRDFFRGSLSWSNIGRAGVQFRQYPPGFVFDVAGMSAFATDETTELNLLGWLNSPLVRTAMDVLAPTLNYQVGDVARLPVPDLTTGGDAARVRELVHLTRTLWAQEPTSWEYRGHPVLLRTEATLSERAGAHVAARDAVLARIADLEQQSADHWADVVEALTGVAVPERAPGPMTVGPSASIDEYVAQAVHERKHGPRSLIGR